MAGESILMLSANASDASRTFVTRHFAGCFCTEAKCDDQAPRRLAELKPALVVLDASKDDFDAAAMCRLLKAQVGAHFTPILIIVARDCGHAVRAGLLDAGADAVAACGDDSEMAASMRALMRYTTGASELREANRRLSTVLAQRGQELMSLDGRYRHLVDNCSDCVLVCSMPGDGVPARIVEVNAALSRLTGYTVEKLLEMNPLDLLTPESRDTIPTRSASILATNQEQFELVLLNAVGRAAPVVVNARLLDAGPAPVLLAIGRASSGETGNAGSRDFAYEDVIEQTGQIMYDLDLTAGKAHWSGATRIVFGYGKEELDALSVRDWHTRIHGDDRSRALREFKRAIRKTGRYRVTYRLLTRFGEYRSMEDTGVVLVDGTGQGRRLLGAIVDVTARLQAEEERRRIEQGAQHAQRLESLGVLAGGIAHDFNNILAAIIGLTDMSLQQIPVKTELHEDLSEVLQAAQRARDLVRQILAFSRESSEERAPLMLHIVVREVFKLIRASVPATIDLIDSVDVHSGAVMASAAQMHQIVMNYCTNALQAMPDGGILELSVHDVEVDQRLARMQPHLRPGPYVRISVRDTGHGMTENIVKRIFDPFFTTKRPGEGTGMGLAVVHGIVTNHGGAITVETKPGRGSIFHTWLPRIEASATVEEHAREVVPTGRERILFIDDEEIVLRFGEGALRRLGYSVSLFARPEEAIATFRETPYAFDLIITDQIMPKITGCDLAKAVRAIRPEIPIVLFTGFSADLDDDYIREAGIDEIVIKPVIAFELATTIRRILDEAARPLP